MRLYLSKAEIRLLKRAVAKCNKDIYFHRDEPVAKFGIELAERLMAKLGDVLGDPVKPLAAVQDRTEPLQKGSGAVVSGPSPVDNKLAVNG